MEEIKKAEAYQELISQSEPVIIKFFADWCPDCKVMDMFINDVIKEHPEYKWFEMNTDQFPEVAKENQVMGIPSLLIFQDGEKKAHLHSANAKSPQQVKDFLDLVKSNQ
jgi:thioredoxin 1